MYKYPVILFFLFLVSTPLVAQNNSGNNSSVEISVQANVLGTTEVITIQSVDFENVERINSEITINPIESSRAGKMIIRGAANSRFRIEYLDERELYNSESTGMLIFTYLVSGNSIDEQETSELISMENRDLTFNSDGEFYIWVGGSVNINEIEPGNYQGEFTLEIEYN